MREVAITYALAPEDALDPGSSCNQGWTLQAPFLPHEDCGRHDSEGTVQTSRLVFP